MGANCIDRLAGLVDLVGQSQGYPNPTPNASELYRGPGW
jgi:hypothetical protein